MPAPNNPDVVKVALIFSRDTRHFVNTFHCYHTGGWTTPDMLALALRFRDWWANFYSVRIPSEIRLVEEQVRLLDPDNPLAVDHPEPSGIAGQLGQFAEAGNVTLALSKRTGLAGRRYRGRIFVPGLGETDVQATDVIDSAASIAFAAAMQALLDSLTTASTPLVIFHKGDNLFSTVTSFVVDALVDSQRRRLAGRGS
jgi:hypothetical protein